MDEAEGVRGIDPGGDRVDPCQGKVAFKSFAIADMAARRGKRRRQAYKCPTCRLWHVGSYAPRLNGKKFKRPTPRRLG